jgi:sec-independent protein translocase protein TatA
MHIAFVVVLLLLVFGARRLPEIGRSLGSGLRELKGSLEGGVAAPALAPPPAESSVASQPVGDPATSAVGPAPGERRGVVS